MTSIRGAALNNGGNEDDMDPYKRYKDDEESFDRYGRNSFFETQMEIGHKKPYASPSYEDSSLPWLEPGEIRMIIPVPIDSLGDVADPDSDKYDFLKTLEKAEEKAIGIVRTLCPDITDKYFPTYNSEESYATVEVTITFLPNK